MYKTANEIGTWVKSSIDTLAQSPNYRSTTAVCREIARLSGMSFSIVAQFHSGYRPNVTMETLDKMAEAMRCILNNAKAA